MRRWTSSGQAAGKLLGEILVERSFCTDDQVIECLATVYGVPYAKLEPRLADPKVVDVPAAGVHREEPRLAAVQDSRHADGRRHRADEPVPDRRAARA